MFPAAVSDEDVLDTWFSSGIFPFSIFGWPNEVQTRGQTLLVQAETRLYLTVKMFPAAGTDLKRVIMRRKGGKL